MLKFFYGLILAALVFLFFCLVLDAFSYLVAKGWNPLLGSWPIFSGTVAAVVYGSWGTVLCLLLGVGMIARIILWDRMPRLLEYLTQPQDGDFV